MAKTTANFTPSFKEEQKIWKRGIRIVVGLDEVGRGAFAGPVVAGAVVFDPSSPYSKKELFKQINDSKLLKPQKRKRIALDIKNGCLYWEIAKVGVNTINKVGIGKATQKAMRKAIASIMYQVLCIKYKKGRTLNTEYLLHDTKFYVLVDGFHIKYLKGIGIKNQKAIVKGDQKCISIGAASIIAKVHRDTIMKRLHKKYPQYGFSKNKGYGTKKHQESIKKNGLSKLHRLSFNLSKFT